MKKWLLERARSSASSSENHPPVSFDPHNAIAAVPPNRVPHSSPPQTVVSPRPSPVNQPPMVFLPIDSSQEDLERVVAATTHGVGVTGSAAAGKIGHPIGSIDISESEDYYLFRVTLPGVARDETFIWSITPNGELVIKGVTTTGEKKVFRNGMEFEMLTQNLCPPAEFSITFQLPGPVDPRDIKVTFGNDGIFEGLVKKK